jgi:hypothetical protein
MTLWNYLLFVERTNLTEQHLSPLQRDIFDLIPCESFLQVVNCSQVLALSTKREIRTPVVSISTIEKEEGLVYNSQLLEVGDLIDHVHPGNGGSGLVFDHGETSKLPATHRCRGQSGSEETCLLTCRMGDKQFEFKSRVPSTCRGTRIVKIVH